MRYHRQSIKYLRNTCLIYLCGSLSFVRIVFLPASILAETVSYDDTTQTTILPLSCETQTFIVNENFSLQDVDLGFNAVHASSRDSIRTRLIHPDGTTRTLIYAITRLVNLTDYDVFLDELASNELYFIGFDANQPFYDFSAAPSNLPNPSDPPNPLSAFDGKSSQGTWTLEICNFSTTDNATYNRSTLILSDTDPAINTPISSNLDFTAGCESGTKLAIVLDASTSVDDTEAQLTREATQELIEEFNDTGTEIGIVEFAQTAQLQVPFTLVNPGTVTSTFTPYLNNTFPDRTSVGGTTNWEAGLQETFDQLFDSDAIIFITDGNPNTYLNENIGNSPVFDADNGFVPVNESIRPANLIKANGTHIYAFGITDAVDIDTLTQVAEGTSSVQFDGANAIFADYEFLSNFTTDVLAQSLTNFAQGLCISSKPRLHLVKRITAINPGQPGENSSFSNSFIDDLNTTDDNYPYWPNDDDLYLPGRINVNNIKPGDEVEYTIYFLSSGGRNAEKVRICDVIPDNMTFSENSFGEGFGIALGLNNASLPTTNNQILSNLSDNDEGEFYPPGSSLPLNFCKKLDSNENLVTVDSLNNINGAIEVNLSNFLPNATAPGVPTNSYGFIRFRAKVK